jgi:amino-acid N-acetyltransferase
MRTVPPLFQRRNNFFFTHSKFSRMINLTLKLAVNKEFDKALKLLENNHLPTSDIGDNVELYTVYDHQNLIGTIGLEPFNSEGLLRSVCFDFEAQNKGFGSKILTIFEAQIREKGIKNLYLLTTTAQRFFEKNNYKVISREDVSDAIRQTTEFKGVCPTSAIVMKKEF